MPQNPISLLAGRRDLRRLFRPVALAAGLCAILAAAGCNDDVTPVRMNTSVAGAWQVQCQPVNEDCSDFAITFAADGDIADTNIDGHRGPQRGQGAIVGTELTFKLGFGTVYEYRGKLDAAGGEATGKMTNYDHDGEQKTTTATLIRK